MEKLPEKWCCVPSTVEELITLNEFIVSNGYRGGRLTRYYHIHFPFIDGGGSAYNYAGKGYTLITFEDFKRLVLKENTENYEIY